MQSNRDSVQIGEEFEITITAELLPILPSQLFFFESQKEFKIKLLLPSGFIQTGGDYYDYIGDSFINNKNIATYTLRGYYAKSVDEPFVLLRGSKELTPTDLFEKKGSLVVAVRTIDRRISHNDITGHSQNVTITLPTETSLINQTLQSTAAPTSGPSAPILTTASSTVCPGGLTSLQVDGCSVGVMKFIDQNGYQWCVSASSPGSSNRISALITIGGIQAGTYRVKCIPTANPGNNPVGTVIPCPTGLGESDWSNAVTITEVCTGPCAITQVPTITGATTLPAGTTQSTLIASGCSADQVVRWYRADDNNRFYPDGSSFTFTNLTSGFQVYAKCVKATCTGPQSAVQTFTIPPTNPCAGNTPAAPSVPGTTICWGGTATLTAQGCPAGSVVNWYAADGNSFGFGNPFSFVNTTSTLTVYATCKVNTCESSKTAATIQVTSPPAAPVTHQDGSSVTDFYFCANVGDGLGLRADGCVGTVSWYRQGEGTVLGTGVTYVTAGGYPASVNYYATCTNSCGTSTPSNLLRVIISPAPTAPVTHQDGSSVTDFYFCANVGDGLGLRADGCAGTVSWYRQGEGTVLGTGVTYVTAGGYAQSVNYYATCTNSCGTSAPSNLLRVIISPGPTPPVTHQDGSSVTDFYFCANVGDGLGLRADGCAGTVSWYRQGEGTVLGTGVTYVTAGGYAQSVNYYATCTNSCGTSTPSNLLRVIISPGPTPPVTHQDGSSATDFYFCANVGDGLGLRADGCVGTVSWYRQGEGTVLGTGVTYVTAGGYAQSVNYYATCTNSCGTSTPSNLLRVVVSQAPAAPSDPSFNGGSTLSVCAGSPLTIASSCSAGQVHWRRYDSAGGNMIGQATLNQLNFEGGQPAGEYYYSVECISSCGSSARKSFTFTVGTPAAPVTHQDGSSVTDFYFCANVGDGLGLRADGCVGTVSWYRQGEGSALGTGVTYVTAGGYAQSVNYYATCTNSCGTSTPSNLLRVVVQPQPTATALVKINAAEFVAQPSYSLTAGGVMAFGREHFGGFDVQWFGPNGAVSPVNQDWVLSNVQPSQSGTYTYKVTDLASGCSNTASVSISITATAANSFSCTCQDCELDAVKLTDNPTVSAGNRGSADQNYVQESVYLDASGNSVSQTITYIDGLGRPIQKVNVASGGKTAGTPVSDIVLPTVYDAFGRESVKYLPYAASTNNGAFRSSAVSDVSTYYSALPDKSGNAFANIMYEASPLNRVLTQTAPGSNTPVSIVYRTNTDNELKLFTYDFSTQKISVSAYGAAQLYVTETTDENGNKTTEYKDKEGRVVGKDVAGRKTLYAYDDFGWLRCVVPPKASGSIGGSVDPFAGDLLFAYDYDGRGRMTRKKVPGAGVTTLTYDSRDRLKTSTDANGTIITTDYDDLDRVVATTNGGTVLTQTFYDSYGSEAKGFDGTHAYDVAAKTDNIKGMTTSTKTLVLGTGTYLTSSTYYDELGRVIQTVSDNHKGGVDRSSLKLDYVGRVTDTKLSTLNNVVVENRTAYDAGSRVKSVCQRVTDAGTATNGSIGQYWEPVARHSYNGIGELTQKTLGCNIQTVDYTYQMRGWLKSMNDPATLDKSATDKRFFGMKLDYDGLSNIITWNYANAQRSGDAGSPFAIQVAQPYTYNFGYDNLNRLKTGTLTQQGQALFGLGGNDDGKINYDDNGNIRNLTRSFKGSVVDNLSYSYKNNDASNQLASVSDGGTNPGSANAFFKDGTANYDYDANGNLLKDSGKGINSNIVYNYLNLPQTVSHSGGSVNYTYSASGQKLKADFGGGKSYDYVAGLVYAGSQLEFIPTGEGRVLPPGLASTTITAGGSATAANSYYRYEYQLKDHLGNLRVACRCGEKANETSPSDTYGPLVVQEQHYDPYGLDLTGLTTQPGLTANRFKYVNRELQPDLGPVL